MHNKEDDRNRGFSFESERNKTGSAVFKVFSECEISVGNRRNGSSEQEQREEQMVDVDNR